MAEDEGAEGLARGVLGILRAPLRVPERVIEALESLATAARDLGPMGSELTRVREHSEALPRLVPAIEQIGKQTEPVADLLAVAERISTQAEPLDDLLPALARVEAGLETKLDSLHEVVAALAGEDSHLHLAILGLGRDLARRLDALNEVVGALDHTVTSAIGDLGRDIDTRLTDLTGVVSAMEGENSHLNRAVGDLGRQLAAMHETINQLREDVERVTDRLPDSSRGPLEKARDVLTGTDRSTDE